MRVGCILELEHGTRVARCVGMGKRFAGNSSGSGAREGLSPSRASGWVLDSPAGAGGGAARTLANVRMRRKTSEPRTHPTMYATAPHSSANHAQPGYHVAEAARYLVCVACGDGGTGRGQRECAQVSGRTHAGGRTREDARGAGCRLGHWPLRQRCSPLSIVLLLCWARLCISAASSDLPARQTPGQRHVRGGACHRHGARIRKPEREGPPRNRGRLAFAGLFPHRAP